MQNKNWTLKVFNFDKTTIKGKKLLAVYDYFWDDCKTKERIEDEIDSILWPPKKYFIELHNPSTNESFVESYWR